MPPQIVHLPGIERVDVPVARQSVPPLHADSAPDYVPTAVPRTVALVEKA